MAANALLFPSSVSAAPIGRPAVPLCTDIDLANCYTGLVTSGAQILFVANAFTVAMWSRPSTTDSWVLSAAGEFGVECISIVSSSIGKKRTYWLATVQPSPQDQDVTSENGALVKVGLTRSWLRKSDEVTGRFGNASADVKNEVAYLAAHRCQFSGCGKDLGRHAATGQAGNSSYFAHIIAASAEGPRGDAVQSPILADEVSNFLLLCDECHRLIDKTAVAEYDVDCLRRMRSQSILEVRRLLGNLQYPDVEVLYILGNLAGQMPHINQRDIDEALWKSKLRQSANGPESYLEIGRLNYDPHATSYWSAALRTLAIELPHMQAKLNGMRSGGGPRPRIAIFPLHGTSILIVAGRILGDMAGTHVFQPHRNTKGGTSETRWAWPDDSLLPAQDKFRFATLKDRLHDEVEANLVISLTFDISTDRLAPVSASGGALLLPTVSISVEQFGHSSIRHPTDLALFGNVVDEALRKLQDEWSVTKVHLYIGAPASAAVLVGQKMQARHQATFVCYESLSGLGAAFAPTITISTHDVTAVGTNHSVPLQP